MSNIEVSLIHPNQRLASSHSLPSLGTTKCQTIIISLLPIMWHLRSNVKVSLHIQDLVERTQALVQRNSRHTSQWRNTKRKTIHDPTHTHSKYHPLLASKLLNNNTWRSHTQLKHIHSQNTWKLQSYFSHKEVPIRRQMALKRTNQPKTLQPLMEECKCVWYPNYPNTKILDSPNTWVTIWKTLSSPSTTQIQIAHYVATTTETHGLTCCQHVNTRI